MTLAAQHLEYWKEKARKDPHEAIYMLHWYDVKAIIPQSTSSNAVEIMTSSLVTMLNTRPKLPQVLVIVFGDIKFWCDNDALKYTMDFILIGLLREVKRIIQDRQRDLPPKAVGEDPQIYMVKLHWKPEKSIDTVHMYPKKRRTFNRLVDTTMKPRGVKTISLNEITVKVDSNFFLGHGSLSETGYRQVWKSLSEAIQDYNTLGYQKQVDFAPKTDYKPVPALLPQYSSCDSDIDDNVFERDTRKFQFKKRRNRQQKASGIRHGHDFEHQDRFNDYTDSRKYFDFN